MERGEVGSERNSILCKISVSQSQLVMCLMLLGATEHKHKKQQLEPGGLDSWVPDQAFALTCDFL